MYTSTGIYIFQSRRRQTFELQFYFKLTCWFFWYFRMLSHLNFRRYSNLSTNDRGTIPFVRAKFEKFDGCHRSFHYRKLGRHNVDAIKRLAWRIRGMRIRVSRPTTGIYWLNVCSYSFCTYSYHHCVITHKIVFASY